MTLFKYFLKLSAKALLEAFLLVKQNSKYTKKIDSVLQGLRKYEVSPHRLLPSSPGAHVISDVKPPVHKYS